MAAQSRKNNPPLLKPPTIPDELLVGLSSTVCNGNKEGHTVHHQHCEVMDPSPGDSILCYNKYMEF